MPSTNANELKIRRVFRHLDRTCPAAGGSFLVRGKDRFVVMDMNPYNYLQE